MELKILKINGRKQRVFGNGVFSDTQTVNSGIPHGSILGPLLFPSYIQLFRQRLSKKSVKAYATMPKGSLGNAK